VGKAVEYGPSSVGYADKSGDEFLRMAGRTTLADGLHQAGEIKEARRLFEEAERMQQERQPEYQYLYSLQGYRYCDLLISLGKYAEVKERARQTLEWAKQGGASLWSLALEKLSLGRALLTEAAKKIKSAKNQNAKVRKRVLMKRSGGWMRRWTG
jgi:tetratricopeptide (TPR) repeat protein